MIDFQHFLNFNCSKSKWIGQQTNYAFDKFHALHLTLWTLGIRWNKIGSWVNLVEKTKKGKGGKKRLTLRNGIK